MVSHELSERSRRLLAALVREHIATGEPVHRRALAGERGLAVSSATIRNMFARLEADGYLHQPHTSAGRVPTDLGYRVFVDLLLESRKPARSTAAEHELRQHAERSPLIDDLLVSVSHMVSRASKHVGFAIGSTDIAVLQRIEFVPLGVTLPALRAVLEMMEEKERMLRLLNQYIDGPGITVVIGGEHLSPDLRPFSLIASTTSDGSTIRTVGVIGPTRMQYSRAISVVDGVTQAVGPRVRN